MAQASEVVEQLCASSPDLDLQTIGFRTSGDASPNAPLTDIGRGVFVKELEESLLRGEIDLAVHSLKDLPSQLPEGLTIAAVGRRADPRDVLVNRWGLSLTRLPAGARIGTSSPRRAAQLAEARPDLEVALMRGNVETRLAKTKNGDYDGAVLAAAGIDRLGMGHEVAERLPAEQFVPAPGQGALAVEIRTEDQTTLEMLACLKHPPTRQAVEAERAFLELLGGGCQLPVGAYGQADGERLKLTVFVASAEGMTFRTAVCGQADNPRGVASECLAGLAEAGAPPLS